MNRTPTPHTDIIEHGWIGQLPPRVRPYALLARLDRPIGTWLLLLPGLWAIWMAPQVMMVERARLSMLFIMGSIVMRAAGCVINDMWDRDLDRKVTRTAGRPLASGALHLWQAALFLGGLLLVGLCILLCLNRLAQELGVVALGIAVLYPLAKRFTWWPQLVMGFTFGAGAPVGYAAATGRIDLSFALLYAATIMWQLGFDTIYGFQDMEDDARIGVKSTSRYMVNHAHVFVGGCYALFMLLLALAGYTAGLGGAFLTALVLPAGFVVWQVLRLDVHNPQRCLQLFRLNRETGLCVLLAVLTGLLT